jgi:hypothetical protein
VLSSKFSLLDLKNAIIAANRDYGVRVFNISMASLMKAKPSILKIIRSRLLLKRK